jgi:hypothetical protein
MLGHTGFKENAKHKSMPALSTKILNRNMDDPDFKEPWSYWTVIGKLNFLYKSTCVERFLVLFLGLISSIPVFYLWYIWWLTSSSPFGVLICSCFSIWSVLYPCLSGSSWNWLLELTGNLPLRAYRPSLVIVDHIPSRTSSCAWKEGMIVLRGLSLPLTQYE